ncbi:thioredoxin family protein [Aequorivita sp. Q41]|uniref:thioredoxin family protein n=1 Tax=Aequorivita sp. Q41 TaxID=3153300 RepID=UPI003242920D
MFFLSVSQTALSQNEGAVHWLTFEQLEDSLKVKPKKVFIEFYADWCAPCLRMQKEVFNESEIINKLNKDYFAVKMNVETTDTITFGNQVFVNERKNRRNPVHQIPLLMALQKNKPFSLPALVFMDKNFKATARYFQYLNKEQFFKIISE